MVHLYLKMAHRSARPDLQEIAPGPAPLIMVPFCSVREGQVQVQAASSQQPAMEAIPWHVHGFAAAIDMANHREPPR
jgi:hypothetical protein